MDFEKVTLRAIPENATRVAALISGEIDACWGVSIPDIPRVEKNKNTYVSRVPSQRTIYVMFDMHSDKGGPLPAGQPGLPAGKPNPFKDFRVRKAIAHAINAEDIIKYVMEGSAYPASQLASPYADGLRQEHPAARSTTPSWPRSFWPKPATRTGSSATSTRPTTGTSTTSRWPRPSPPSWPRWGSA